MLVTQSRDTMESKAYKSSTKCFSALTELMVRGLREMLDERN